MTVLLRRTITGHHITSVPRPPTVSTYRAAPSTSPIRHLTGLCGPARPPVAATAEACQRLRFARTPELPSAAAWPIPTRLGGQFTAISTPGRGAGADGLALHHRTRAAVLTRLLGQADVGDEAGRLLGCGG